MTALREGDWGVIANVGNAGAERRAKDAHFIFSGEVGGLYPTRVEAKGQCIAT